VTTGVKISLIKLTKREGEKFVSRV